MVAVPGTGLLLGHGVARFDPRPGLPNSIAPGKQPLHNMAPFLALRNGRPFAAFGLPGGRTIPNNQVTLAVGLIDRGLDPRQALDAARLHTEGAEPLEVERRAGKRVLEGLRKLGHRVETGDRDRRPRARGDGCRRSGRSGRSHRPPVRRTGGLGLVQRHMDNLNHP